MTQFLQIAKVVLSLIPVLIDVIKSLEKAFPAVGLGAQKLAVVREAFNQIYASVDEALPEIEKVWSIAETMISALVKLFNYTGQFKTE